MAPSCVDVGTKGSYVSSEGASVGGCCSVHMACALVGCFGVLVVLLVGELLVGLSVSRMVLLSTFGMVIFCGLGCDVLVDADC